MPMCDIKDHKTGQTLKAYDFGGPEIYYVGDSLVYAPLGGTSVSSSENLATLNPLGITSIMKPRWEVTGHTDIGTANWRVSVVDTLTGETKDGVYPFNLQGNVYELECQPGTWVIASCGGYKIESSWEGKQNYELYRLKGTDEKISMEGLGSFKIYYTLATFYTFKDGTQGSAPSIEILYIYDNIYIDLCITYDRPGGIAFYDYSVNVGNSSNLAIAFTDLIYSLYDNLYNLCVSYNQLSYTHETWSLADYNTVINLHSNAYLESFIFSDFIASPRVYAGSEYGNKYNYPLYKYK